jgi:glycerol-3-phosphate acyltransferase PlsY
VEYLPEFSAGGAYYPNGLDAIRVGLVVVAVLGHIFPLFAGFKGGKGVATLAGAVMGVAPSAVLLCLAVWVLVLMMSHYVSLSSMVAGCTFPVFILLARQTQGSVVLIVFSCVVAVLLLITHRKNIKRLRAGTEPKTYIWKKPPPPKPPKS